MVAHASTKPPPFGFICISSLPIVDLEKKVELRNNGDETEKKKKVEKD